MRSNSYTHTGRMIFQSFEFRFCSPITNYHLTSSDIVNNTNEKLYNQIVIDLGPFLLGKMRIWSLVSLFFYDNRMYTAQRDTSFDCEVEIGIPFTSLKWNAVSSAVFVTIAIIHRQMKL